MASVKPLKLFLILIPSLSVVVTLYIFLLMRSTHQDTRDNTSSDYTERTTKYIVSDIRKQHIFKGEKIIHLDLKGAPPKISYYRKIFPLLSQLGVTGLLLEYEDMFPYSGRLENISALNAYSLEDVSIINKLAKENHLKIIPLIQIFSHMEFILKLADFKELREVPSYPEVICPTHKDTAFLLVTMIQQIVRAHPDSEMIHIGTDEVEYVGHCNRCYHYVQSNPNSKNLLFLNHIANVTSVLKIMYPKLRILMWDNQIRSMSRKELEGTGLNTKIEPVVLHHGNNVLEDLGPSLWENYGKTFRSIWAASAFKGTTGGFLTHFNKYQLNQKGWITIFGEYGNAVNFEGIILGGWQRDDHFAVLSELFPVAIPSLAIGIRLLTGHVDSPLNPPIQISKILQCKQPYALMSSAFGSPKCSYPGGDILEYVIQLHQLMQEYDAIVEDVRYERWMNEYNIKHSFSSPSQIEGFTSFLSKIKNDLAAIDVDITLALSEIYDDYTIEEWKETYIKPFKIKVQSMWEAKKNILMKDVWPRRPLMLNGS